MKNTLKQGDKSRGNIFIKQKTRYRNAGLTKGQEVQEVHHGKILEEQVKQHENAKQSNALIVNQNSLLAYYLAF